MAQNMTDLSDVDGGDGPQSRRKPQSGNLADLSGFGGGHSAFISPAPMSSGTLKPVGESAKNELAGLLGGAGSPGSHTAAGPPSSPASGNLADMGVFGGNSGSAAPASGGNMADLLRGVQGGASAPQSGNIADHLNRLGAAPSSSAPPRNPLGGDILQVHSSRSGGVEDGPRMAAEGAAQNARMSELGNRRAQLDIFDKAGHAALDREEEQLQRAFWGADYQNGVNSSAVDFARLQSAPVPQRMQGVNQLLDLVRQRGERDPAYRRVSENIGRSRMGEGAAFSPQDIAAAGRPGYKGPQGEQAFTQEFLLDLLRDPELQKLLSGQ
jgi:hypothetical protein